MPIEAGVTSQFAPRKPPLHAHVPLPQEPCPLQSAKFSWPAFLLSRQASIPPAGAPPDTHPGSADLAAPGPSRLQVDLLRWYVQLAHAARPAQSASHWLSEAACLVAMVAPSRHTPDLRSPRPGRVFGTGASAPPETQSRVGSHVLVASANVPERSVQVLLEVL